MIRMGPLCGAAVLLAVVTTACSQDEAMAEQTVAETAATETAPRETAASVVDALPLKRGFYVESSIACGQSSNATTLLVGRDAINGSQDSCTFKRIEKTGATSYRVTSECSEGGGWGREEEVATYTNSYDIPDETSFKVTYEDGSDKSLRYCEQSSMSSDYRDNDISDMIR